VNTATSVSQQPVFSMNGEDYERLHYNVYTMTASVCTVLKLDYILLTLSLHVMWTHS
jgi:hypothetical protein